MLRFRSSMSLTTDSLTAFSANANLLASNGASPAITVPLVQGMGFVTAIYNGVTPFIDSSIFFRTISPLPSPKTGVTKYKLLLEDGKTWLLYATATNGTGLALTPTSSSRLSAAGPFTGTIQVAKNPGDVATQEASYDSAAGSYPTSASISGSVDGVSGSYTLSWTKAGNGSPVIMNALPHHIQSMDATTSAGKTGIQLQSTTHGTMTGVIGDSWTMVEPDIPANMTFAPWIAADGSTAAIPASAVAQINAAGTSELAQDMNAQSNLNSMYYSGKALSKFATAIYAIHDLTGDTALASSGLDKLKTAYAVFANNKQQYPLVYESAWGGVVSSAAYVTGNAGDDFGNSYYNDHHFHWSYFVHAAAIIGYLDPTWIPANKDWVNTLVRDAGNPIADDQYFPFSRSFDWFHGHSWAKGLFDSADGKDQESTSEDALFAYAMKMWGKTSGDANMEARGNLMLAVMKRSLSNYFLLESTNTNQPANFIGNKVTGILFENKVDHVTYFGANPEYIQGIHMLPIVPSSAYLRNQNFVAEEWKTYFDNGRVDQVAGGWRGVLYSNLALIDAKASYGWFSGSSFDPQYLDGGASLTWSLAMAAGLGGAN
jgi:endo-1,3(4)-beta-glucanase